MITAVVLGVVGVGLLVGTLVQGHPSLAQFGNASTPAPGAVVLSDDLTRVEVVFTEESVGDGLIVENSIFWVVRVEGRRVVATGGVDLDSPGRNTMSAELDEPLEAGVYFIKWVGISGGDIGFSEGEIIFSVEASE